MTAIFKIVNLPIFTLRLKKRKEKLLQRRILYKKIIIELDKWIEKNFESEGKKAHPGKGWEPLSAKTILARERGWGEYVKDSSPAILHNKGFLRNNWDAKIDNRTASYFSKATGGKSKVYYGFFHHKGGKHLPKRRIVPTQKQFSPILKKMGVRHIRIALK